MKNARQFWFLAAAILSLTMAYYVYADTVIISRTTRGMMVQGGTTDLNGSTVVVADSSTNEYKIVQVTATVAGANTSFTNTFTTAFLASPVVLRGTISGQSAPSQSNNVAVSFTITSTNIIIGNLSTNGSTGVNNIPLILYGYQRTGKFQ